MSGQQINFSFQSHGGIVYFFAYVNFVKDRAYCLHNRILPVTPLTGDWIRFDLGLSDPALCTELCLAGNAETPELLHCRPKIQYSKKSKQCRVYRWYCIHKPLCLQGNIQTQSNPGMEKKGFEIQYYKDINIILNNSSF
jgi:hypothetical protein